MDALLLKICFILMFLLLFLCDNIYAYYKHSYKHDSCGHYVAMQFLSFVSTLALPFFNVLVVLVVFESLPSSWVLRRSSYVYRWRACAEVRNISEQLQSLQSVKQVQIQVRIRIQMHMQLQIQMQIQMHM